MTKEQYHEFRIDIDDIIRTLKVAKESAFQSTRTASLTEDELLQEETNLSYALFDAEETLQHIRDYCNLYSFRNPE